MYIIPISQKNVVEMSGEVVNKSLEGVSTEDITHLIYCHELLNLPQPITVAMNIKNKEFI
jgi:folate-binding Fe-S cluster repair protein YgfZ